MNLLKELGGFLTDQVLDKMGSAVGESTGVSKALEGILPTMLGGLIKNTRSSDGAGALASMLDRDHDGSILDDVVGMFANGDSIGKLTSGGEGLVGNIFGKGQNGVIDAISSFSGIGKGSAGTLMKMAAPLLFGLLGRAKKKQGLDAAGLASLLGSQAGHIKDAMPAGLNDSMGLSSMLGGLLGGAKDAVSGTAGAVGGAVTGAADKVGDAAGAVATGVGDAGRKVASGAAAVGGSAVAATGAAASTGFGWLKGLLPILLIGLGIWWLMGKGCGDTVKDGMDATTEAVGSAAGAAGDMAGDAVGAVGDAAGAVGDAVGDAAGAAGDAVTGMFDWAKGATASDLDLAPGSALAGFVDYLRGGAGDMDQTFTLDKVTYATGSSTLTPESRAQLDEVRKVLEAYPTVSLEVQGHTDNVGSAAANLNLSQQRAYAVRTFLVSSGVEGARLEAEGYGDKNPTASNDTAEGRAQNRRTDFKVIKK